MLFKPSAALFLAVLAALEFPHPSTSLSVQNKQPHQHKWPYEFHVAPMQGYTNAPLRHLLRLLSPNAVLWTEMEKIRDLNDAVDDDYSSNALQKRFGDPHPEQPPQPLTLQLGGNDPWALEQCVASLGAAGYSFREINVNCGCPSIEAGGAAEFGASLMKQPDLTRQLMEAIGNGLGRHPSAASSPPTTISLKCRTAVFETVEDMETILGGGNQQAMDAWKEQQFQSLHSYISQAQRGGIEHVALHARPAVLAGLSPSKNRLVPPLDYALVEKVATEFPDLRVTLNGGISSMNDLDALIQRQQQSSSPSGKVASHMAGRWILQHPLALAAVQSKYLTNTNTTTDNKDTLSNTYTQKSDFLGSVVNRYMLFVEDSLARKIHSLSELCLPLYLVIEELRTDFDDDGDEEEPDGILHENELYDIIIASEEECYGVLKDALERLSDSLPAKARKAKALPEDIHWKKLSTYLKGLVGTKVYNKWKRNRNELAS